MALKVIGGDGVPAELASDVVGIVHTTHHKITGLPGSTEVDIGASKGFLATIATLTAAVSGYLQTLAVAPSAATPVTVPASATVVTLAASKATRVGLLVVNNSTSTSTLYLKLGSAASLSSWSVAIDPGGYWEMPPRYYSGIVTGIWSNATGDAHVTETG